MPTKMENGSGWERERERARDRDGLKTDVDVTCHDMQSTRELIEFFLLCFSLSSFDSASPSLPSSPINQCINQSQPTNCRKLHGEAMHANGKLIAEKTAFVLSGCMYVYMRDHSSNRMCVWFSESGKTPRGCLGRGVACQMIGG